MRIVASNPDNIGDLVLRQPLYSALASAGHELMLIVRSSVVPVVPLLLGPPAASPQTHVLSVDPYSTDNLDDAVQQAATAARAFGAELLVIAAYQRTRLDEQLAAALDGVEHIAMSGKLFAGDPRSGVQYTSGLRADRVVEVTESLPELRKNELLASAVLQQAVALPQPVLSASSRQVDLAQWLLGSHGIRPGEYWVACVGDNRYTRVRNWHTDGWARVLRTWAQTYGRRFVLVGSDDEAASVQQVVDAMGPEASRSAVVVAGQTDLDTLCGLLALGSGYVGRDTGPMHVAAAMNKPVLALFGGGTWPRFIPAAQIGCALSIQVPCAGCDWLCGMRESYCIKSLSPEEVLSAIDDLEAGRIAKFQVRAPAADELLVSRMLRESVANVRQQVLESARLARASSAPQAEPAQTQRLASELRQVMTQLTAAQGVCRDLEVRLRTAEEQRAMLRSSFQQLDARQGELLAQVQQLERELGAAAGHRDALMEQVQRISRSKWHRLGRMLGLKLESATAARTTAAARTTTTAATVAP